MLDMSKERKNSSIVTVLALVRKLLESFKKVFLHYFLNYFCLN